MSVAQQENNAACNGRSGRRHAKVALPRPIRSNNLDRHQVAPLTFPHFAPSEFNFGRYLSYRMEELGVKHFFTVPGDSTLLLLDTLLENKNMKMVGCCNELNTGYAADGYARASNNRVAVVIVPYIVGGLSVLNAIAGAYSEYLRVIVISGCPDARFLSEDKQLLHHTPGKEKKDLGLRAYREVTAAAVRVSNIETALDVLDDTLLTCLRESRPVYIEVANDLAHTTCFTPGQRPAPLASKMLPVMPVMNRSIVEAIIQTWNAAKRPVLLVGGVAHLSCSHSAIVSLAEKLGCAVFVHPDARIFPESHPQFAGCLWPTLFNFEAERVFREADLWLVLGGRWSDLHTLGSIDLDKEAHRMIDLQHDSARLPSGLQGGIGLNLLVSELMKSEVSSNDRTVRELADHRNLGDTSSEPVTVAFEPPESPVTLSRVVDGIQRLMGENDTLIADTGETWFTSQDISLPSGGHCLAQVVYASLGWSLPAGLGCQLARPNGRTIIMIGDGAFQMTAQELSTMIRMKTNPIVFIFNNLGYRTEVVINDGPYNYIGNWNYASLARTVSSVSHCPNHNPWEEQKAASSDAGVISMQIHTLGDLEHGLQRAATETSKLVLFECCIRPNDINPALRRLGMRFNGQVQTNGCESSGEGISRTAESSLGPDEQSKAPNGNMQPPLARPNTPRLKVESPRCAPKPSVKRPARNEPHPVVT